MIDPKSNHLIAPKHNLGIDADAYNAKLKEQEKNFHRKLLVFMGIPIVIATVITAIIVHPGMLFIGGFGFIFLYIVYTVRGMELERTLEKEYNAEFKSKLSEWATEKLVPYLNDEHGITVLEDNFLDLFRANSQGMRATNKEGEIIRFKLDGATFKHQGLACVISFHPEGLRVMVLQKSL